MTRYSLTQSVGEAYTSVCVCVFAFGLYPGVIIPTAPPAPAQRPRCVHLDAEQWEAHGLRPRALQGHPVLQRGRGERQGVRQGQDRFPQGEAATHTEAHDRRRHVTGGTHHGNLSAHMRTHDMKYHKKTHGIISHVRKSH